MELLKLIGEKLIFNIFDRIGFIEISTGTCTIVPLEEGLFKEPAVWDYEKLLLNLCKFVSPSQREAARRELELPAIIKALEEGPKNSVIRFVTFLHDSITYYYQISYLYFDDAKTSVIIAFYDETTETVKQFELIKKLRKTEDCFNFLTKSICDDFMETDIQTGNCSLSRMNRNYSPMQNHKKQIAWFADNLVVEEEREAYIREYDLQHLIKSLRSNGGMHTATYTVLYEDGRHYLYIVSTLVQDSMDPDYEYIISFAQDVTELIQHKKQNEKLMALSRELLDISQNDSLTNIFNRSAGEKAITMRLQNRDMSERGTLILIDIDFFKQVNDTYGHTTGDDVLKYMSKAMKDVFRSDDVLCRWGGDEFLVFMGNVIDRIIIESRLERLRLKMSGYRKGNRSIPVTISIGAAIIQKNQKESLDTLFKRADQYLYKAKESGRNTFIIEVH